MSATEQHTAEPAPFDPTSSIEVWTSAKGAVQWKCKVRSVSNLPQDVREAFDLEMELADKLTEKYGGFKQTGAS